MTSPQKNVLITGASTGIGYELARCFAQEGYSLLLVSRHKERLQDAANQLQKEYPCSIQIFPKDLAQENAPQELFAEITQQQIPIHILVNNAGIGVYGEFASTNLEEELQMLQLNVLALTALTKLCLPQMKKDGSGRILNVASTAAFQPGPLMAVYYASKAYVLSFSLALSCELAQSGITLSTLCPGPTRTEFIAQAKMGEINILKGKMTQKMFMSAEKVARIGYRGLLKGKRTIIPGLSNRCGALFVRFIPLSWTLRFLKRIMAKSST